MQLPIWFQSIKAVSATKSGLMNLPMLLGVILFSIIAGYAVSKIGYYTPFMYAAPILSSIGAGLLSRFNANSPSSEWIGYQAFYGIGLGLGMSQAIVAVQAAMSPIDIPRALAFVTFMQALGGSVSVSVAQNVLRNQLLHILARDAPEVNAYELISAGPSTVRQIVPEDMLEDVLVAYNSAIIHTFYVGVAFSAVAIFGALPMRWISVKGKEQS